MRFGAKIGLVLVAVGVAPVGLAGLVAARAARDELRETVGAMQARGAGDLARHVERFVEGSLGALRLSAAPLHPLEAFAPAELGQLLALPYRQLPYLSIVAIVDDARRPVAGPVFARQPSREPALATRPVVGADDLERFARHLPVAPAREAELATSAPYRPAGAGPVRLAATLRLGPRRALAAELVLSEVEARLRERTGERGVAFAVDPSGAVIAHGEPAAWLTPDERALVADGLARGPLTRLVERRDGRRWLAAFAPVNALGWGVVVAQPEAVAFAAADAVRLRTAAGAGGALVLALLFGWVVARRVTRRVERLSEAAGKIAAGDYAPWAPPVDGSGSDEISALGRAFARMAVEIGRRDDEIRTFNRDLQRRVDERTAELAAAQDQIQRTRRLAALGSLGAGLAHELNNPLSAVTGYLGLLARDLDGTPHAPVVQRAREQAARVARVVDDLRMFADPDRGAGRRFSLVRPVEAALALYQERLAGAGIELTKRFDEVLPEARGDASQIQQVVAHLLDNALHAMPGGGRLEVSVGAVNVVTDGPAEALRLTVADSGRGIPAGLRERIFDPFFTTKGDDAAGRVGLGLSVSHRIVEAHHGRIFVEGREGPGAAVTVLLPAAAEPHLQ
ncbi:MAG: ATP-binding protein [Anaeromyxobacteraceae bacterium]